MSNPASGSDSERPLADVRVWEMFEARFSAHDGEPGFMQSYTKHESFPSSRADHRHAAANGNIADHEGFERAGRHFVPLLSTAPAEPSAAAQTASVMVPGGAPRSVPAPSARAQPPPILIPQPASDPAGPMNLKPHHLLPPLQVTSPAGSVGIHQHIVAQHASAAFTPASQKPSFDGDLATSLRPAADGIMQLTDWSGFMSNRMQVSWSGDSLRKASPCMQLPYPVFIRHGSCGCKQDKW